MRTRHILASLFILVTGCGDSSDETGAGAGAEFECVGVCVGDLALSLPDGRLHDAGLPEATTRGDEPVVTSADWVPVSKNVFAMELYIASAAPVTVVYVEINGSVYAIEPAVLAGSAPEIDACEILEEQQGYGCTEACIEACSCVTCEDSAERRNLVDACSTNCSVQSNQGSIGPEPYTSEEVFVDILYNGLPDSALPGTLESRPGCSGQICSARAGASKRNDQRVHLAFAFGDDSFLADLDVGNLVAQSGPVDDTPATGSPTGAPAEVNIRNNGCFNL